MRESYLEWFGDVMNEGTKPEAISVQKAALLLGVHENTIYNWIKAGVIEASKSGGRMLSISLEQVGRLLDTEGKIQPTDDCGVYFIECGSFIKIGISDQIQRRLHSMAASNPFDLKPLGLIRCKYSEARRIEESLHRQFQGVRHRGEWFHDNDELREMIKTTTEPWPA